MLVQTFLCKLSSILFRAQPLKIATIKIRTAHCIFFETELENLTCINATQHKFSSSFVRKNH